MRNLIYFIAVTLDGLIARDDGSFDFFPMSGDHLSFIIEEYPETIPGHLRTLLGARGKNRHFDAVLMGRHTYEVGLNAGVTNPYPHLQQYVVSTTMSESLEPEIQLISNNTVEFVRTLKQTRGQAIWLCGGARLAGALFNEIDEIILKINPVVLGTGKPLFQNAQGPMNLALLEHISFESGVAIHRYRVER